MGRGVTLTESTAPGTEGDVERFGVRSSYHSKNPSLGRTNSLYLALDRLSNKCSTSNNQKGALCVRSSTSTPF